MAYDYYCTHCGRKLDQEKVLFNMETVLTGSTYKENSLRQLRFRLTLRELEDLVARGEPTENGFHRCTMGYVDLLVYLANANNMADPVITSLTMEDIEEYTKIEIFDDEYDESDDFSFDTLAFGFMDEASEGKRVKPDTDGAQKKETCAAIAALEKEHPGWMGVDYIKEKLAHDLGLLKNLFAGKDTIDFDIRLVREKDNDGGAVTTGYIVRSGRSVHTSDASHARVCPSCGQPIFEHAGTAEHKIISLIGEQNGGVTSTLLALADYAERGLLGPLYLGNPIWRNSSPIESVSYIDLLDKDKRLRTELENYRQGISPAKTDALRREDAYGITFRIKNRLEKDKYFLITLVELPGEVCDYWNGKIAIPKIMDEFQIALRSCAYILCFNTKTAREPQCAVHMAQNVCGWANEFQKLRYQECYDQWKEQGGDPDFEPGYVPIMILYTKWEDLEDPTEETSSVACPLPDPIKRCYAFWEEAQKIDKNPIYAFLGERLREYDALRSAYQTRLRVSPFGYAARCMYDHAFDSEQLRLPEPKNIDLLMKWILSVTGVIPVDATYEPILEMRFPIRLTGYFVTRVQYRRQSPGGRKCSREDRFKEALARCYLFENPGVIDVEYVKSCNSKWGNMKLRLAERFRKRKNDAK